MHQLIEFYFKLGINHDDIVLLFTGDRYAISQSKFLDQGDSLQAAGFCNLQDAVVFFRDQFCTLDRITAQIQMDIF